MYLINSYLYGDITQSINTYLTKDSVETIAPHSLAVKNIDFNLTEKDTAQVRAGQE